MKMITTRTLTISQYVTNMEFNEDIKSSIGEMEQGERETATKLHFYGSHWKYISICITSFVIPPDYCKQIWVMY